MGYHVNIMQCMQHNFLLTGQVYIMLMSSVLQAWVTLGRESTFYKLIVNFFLNGVVLMFLHDIVYIELLYCVTNFELVWTCSKAAVVENAKKCRLYPTFPLFQVICPYFGWIIAFRCACDVTNAPRIASTAANKLCWRNCPDKCHY